MNAPTRGQVERNLSQRIQTLYRSELGHQPSQVSCQLFDGKIAIVMENAITQPEQLLANTGQSELAEQVRDDLQKALQPQIKALISEVVGVEVVDLLSDATLETGRTGMIAVLAGRPQLRNPS